MLLLMVLLIWPGTARALTDEERDAVLDALAATGSLSGQVLKLAVSDMPGSGTPEELRAWAGIDPASIVARARAAIVR